MNKNTKNGFTLIEILVVATIIGMLAAVAAVSYTSFTQQSRNARRKADLEQIRAAIEMWRSNSATSNYPSNANLSFGSCSLGALNDGPPNNNTYLSKIPNDPKCSATPQFVYRYNAQAGNTDYTLGTRIEATSGTTPCLNIGGNCGAAGACNYCLGPYGEK